MTRRLRAADAHGLDPRAEPSPKPARSEPVVATDSDAIGEQVLADLIRRVREIDAAYRATAEKMGQLYMYADQHELSALTRSLDQPMRNAAENERALAAILDELRLHSKRRTQGKY